MAPKSSAVPYEKVNVLMLSWKDVDDPTERKEFQSQLRSLSEEFRAYRFDVEEYEIESDVPYRKLSRRLDEFLHHDQEGGLLIIYYGGHGLNNRDSHCIWLRDNPEDSDDDSDGSEPTNPAVNWSTLQSLFLDDCLGHVLFLLDCCYAGSSVKMANSASIVEVIAAAGFDQVASLRGPDSFSTFLTKVLKEIRSQEATIVASVLARRIAALLNSTDAAVKGTRVMPRHFPFHNGRSFIEIGPLSGQQLGRESSATIHRERKSSFFELRQRPFDALSPRDHNIRSISKNSSHPALQESLNWGDVLMDDDRRAGPQPPNELEEMRRHPAVGRTPELALENYNPPDPTSFIFERRPLQGRQIRMLQIKPKRAQIAFGLPEEIIVCTVKTTHVLVKSTDVPEIGYKALSWYCSHEAPRNSKMLILPEAQAVLIPDHLAAALWDIRDHVHEISVWAYQVCIDHRSTHEVEEQTALVPEILRHASEVVVCPTRGDNSTGVIDLRNIGDRIVGSPSPVPAPISNFTGKPGTPPIYRPRHDNTPASAPVTAKSPAAATARC